MISFEINPARAEDGSRLWLRYERLESATAPRAFCVQGRSPTCEAIGRELRTALAGLGGGAVQAVDDRVAADGTIVVVGTPENSPAVRELSWREELSRLGPEGFVVRSASVDGHEAIVIASAGEVGSLYGTFHLLRLLQAGGSLEHLNVSQSPKLRRRLLDHWDNLDGSIERGYAGRSLWRWDELPATLSPRYADYARACASIGINGSVLNNVNASAKSLSPAYLKKTAALAEVLRPYGVRVYLSSNFAAPKTLGGLPTADPLDPKVAAWWKGKSDEIYQLIPDFGGFVVKANSEGQPGPQDYGRTHADGANVLADAVAPHGGIVMWRAFVYNQDVDADRAKRAYIEFTALDGKFRSNVTVQVKNGPIDFMPREPFHPLFGALTRTPVMAELQVTQEYLGHSNHLVYLAPMWKEFLDSDTFAKGSGSTVAKVIEGQVQPYELTGIAAVANTGDDANWCGHHFAQANWYAYGRLAWDPDLSAEQIAEEWLRMTFTRDPRAVGQLKQLMMSSWETFVSYTMPLGLHHLIGGNHYAPQPWNAREPRPDWTAVYYHHADASGVGFDRTATGSNAVSQYFPPVRQRFADVNSCPENLLLWFHHVPWSHRVASGRTLWEALCDRYDGGFRAAVEMRDRWRALADVIHPRRHAEVGRNLEIQITDARTWRDQCVRYFQRFSRLPIPQWETVPAASPPD
jgi:alpha-glucuronidase